MQMVGSLRVKHTALAEVVHCAQILVIDEAISAQCVADLTDSNVTLI